MFFEFFEDLRKKSVEARKRFAFIFAFSVTLVVVFIYLLSLFFSKIATRSTDDAQVNNSGNKEKTVLEKFNKSNVFLDNPDINSYKNNNIQKKDLDNTKHEMDYKNDFSKEEIILIEGTTTDSQDILMTF